MSKKIAVIVGSLRKESYNRKIAEEMIRLSEGKLEMEIVEIADYTRKTWTRSHRQPGQLFGSRLRVQTAS